MSRDVKSEEIVVASVLLTEKTLFRYLPAALK